MFNNPDFDPDCNIYPGAAITKGQLLGLLLALIFRHGISGAGLSDTLKLMNTMVPGCVPKSKYFFDKSFFNFSSLYQIHHYCKSCLGYLGRAYSPCSSCNEVFNSKENIANGNYFLVMPLKTQLKDLFTQDEVLHSLKQNLSARTAGNHDIYSGQMYKSQLNDFNRNTENITLSFNVDGASVFKSSNYSIWPIFCTINELPFHLRGKHAILHSLWFGHSKPQISTLFKPFVEEMNELFTAGFNWVDKDGLTHNCKVAPGVCVCDAPARAMVQGMKQFNGKYGCGFCLHMGEVVPKGNGHVRVYPQTMVCPPSRTHAGTIEHASAAVRLEEDVMGIKEASPLLLLPQFDIIQHVVPEYMHGICLGVTKQFVNLWCDSKNSGSPFYIKPHGVQQIDSELKKLKPPNEVHRNPRPLSERQYWKATEWRAFLLFYSPVLMKSTLPSQFYRHWLLLVFAIHTLLLPEVHSRALNAASSCLTKFVVNVAELYGKAHVSYNVHCLLHLTDSVKLWGPLWVYSAFMYEDNIGCLLDLFHGTQAIPLQIFKYFFSKKRLVQNAELLFSTAPSSARNLFSALTNKRLPSNRSLTLGNGIHALGYYTERLLSVQEKIVLENYIEVNENIKEFTRCLIEKTLYSTEAYAMNFKRNNSCAAFKNGNYGLIKSFLLCKPFCSCVAAYMCNCVELYILSTKLKKDATQLRYYDDFSEVNIASHITNVQRSSEILACKPSDILCKCVFINVSNSYFVLKVPVFDVD